MTRNYLDKNSEKLALLSRDKIITFSMNLHTRLMVSLVHRPYKNLHYHVKLNVVFLPMFPNDFPWKKDHFPLVRCWKSIVYLNLKRLVHEIIITSRTEFSLLLISENVQPMKTLHHYLHKEVISNYFNQSLTCLLLMSHEKYHKGSAYSFFS
jgi:hypothetical protein